MDRPVPSSIQHVEPRRDRARVCSGPRTRGRARDRRRRRHRRPRRLTRRRGDPGAPAASTGPFALALDALLLLARDAGRARARARTADRALDEGDAACSSRRTPRRVPCSKRSRASMSRPHVSRPACSRATRGTRDRAVARRPRHPGAPRSQGPQSRAPRGVPRLLHDAGCPGDLGRVRDVDPREGRARRTSRPRRARPSRGSTSRTRPRSPGHPASCRRRGTPRGARDCRGGPWYVERPGAGGERRLDRACLVAREQAGRECGLDMDARLRFEQGTLRGVRRDEQRPLHRVPDRPSELAPEHGQRPGPGAERIERESEEGNRSRARCRRPGSPRRGVAADGAAVDDGHGATPSCAEGPRTASPITPAPTMTTCWFGIERIRPLQSGSRTGPAPRRASAHSLRNLYEPTYRFLMVGGASCRGRGARHARFSGGSVTCDTAMATLALVLAASGAAAGAARADEGADVRSELEALKRRIEAQDRKIQANSRRGRRQATRSRRRSIATWVECRTPSSSGARRRQAGFPLGKKPFIKEGPNKVNFIFRNQVRFESFLHSDGRSACSRPRPTRSRARRRSIARASRSSDSTSASRARSSARTSPTN